jgi:hypothetical protein
MAAADGVTAQLATAVLDGAAGAAAAAPGGEAVPAAEQVVTPWDVQGGAGGIDYDKLLTTFGCQPINAELIARCVACARCAGSAGLRLTRGEPAASSA